MFKAKVSISCIAPQCLQSNRTKNLFLLSHFFLVNNTLNMFNLLFYLTCIYILKS